MNTSRRVHYLVDILRVTLRWRKLLLTKYSIVVANNYRNFFRSSFICDRPPSFSTLSSVDFDHPTISFQLFSYHFNLTTTSFIFLSTLDSTKTLTFFHHRRSMLEIIIFLLRTLVIFKNQVFHDIVNNIITLYDKQYYIYILFILLLSRNL